MIAVGGGVGTDGGSSTSCAGVGYSISDGGGCDIGGSPEDVGGGCQNTLLWIISETSSGEYLSFIFSVPGRVG